MPYKVTYETNKKPTDLPPGATVVEVGPLPFKQETHLGRRLIVEEDDNTTIWVEIRSTEDDHTGIGAYIRKPLAVEFGRAILEAAGEAVSITKAPVVVFDCSDDSWTRQSDGTYRWTDGASNTSFQGYSLERLETEFGPLRVSL